MSLIFKINSMIEVYKSHCRKPSKRETLILLALTLIGLFGNYLNIDLFFGVNFIFGSIATIIAIRVSGPVWGVLVGVVIGSYSYILWGHPYAIIIFGLEAYIIGLFTYVLKKDSLIIIDVGYWILLGMPLVWVFYTYSIGLPEPIVTTIAAKQMANGVINVALASLLIQFTPMLKWINLGLFKDNCVTMNSSVTTLLSVFILIPMLIVTISSAKNELEKVYQRQADNVIEQVHDVQYDMISTIDNYALITELMVNNSMESDRHNQMMIQIYPHNTVIDSSIQLAPGILSTEIISTDGEVLFSYPEKPLGISKHVNHLSSILPNSHYFLHDEHFKGTAHEVERFTVIKSIADGRFQSLTFTTSVFDKLLAHFSERGNLVQLLDEEGHVVLSNNAVDLSGFVRGVDVDNKQILLPENTKISAIKRSKQSYYDSSIMFNRGSDWKIYTAIPMAKSIQSMQSNYREKFILMLVISILSLLLVPFVSRSLSAPLKELTKTTDMLRDSIKRTDVIWPKSNMREIHSLIDNFQNFVEKINENQQVLINSEKNVKISLLREKELSALTSRFTSMVSHEFRTPLTTINATSDIILKYADKMSQDDINLRLQTIKNEVVDMTSMLEDVLILGKSDAQKLEYNPEFLDVVSLVKDIIAGYQLSDADNRDIIYHQSSPVIMLTLDKKWIKNIVINLISNAVKYSDKDTAVEVSINEDKAGVSLSFKDYGIGIAQEDIKNLFEPFYRASNVGDIPGTGLGLIVLQKAIELHNGKIKIESELGKGSNFIVTLPNV